MSLPSDEAVMAAVQQGHVQLLGVLFERHHGTALSVCLGFVRNRAAADDLVQEAFLRVLRYRESYRPDATFGAWLRRILRNVCLDYLARSSREEAALRQVASCESGSYRFGESTELKEDDRGALHDALERLPEHARESLVLKRVHGLSYAEIAERFGTSAGAERVRVHRALRQLKNIMHATRDDGYAVS